MRLRIVIADQSEAHFYDAFGVGRALIPAGSVANPVAHMRDQELVSDRPGRTMARAVSGGRHRTAGAHHATGGERTPRRHAVELYARHVAAELERARRAKQFDGIVLIAGPIFLGRLRSALPAALRPLVAATVVKDIAAAHDIDARAYLKPEMFAGPLNFAPTALRVGARQRP